MAANAVRRMTSARAWRSPGVGVGTHPDTWASPSPRARHSPHGVRRHDRRRGGMVGMRRGVRNGPGVARNGRCVNALRIILAVLISAVWAVVYLAAIFSH